MKNNLSDRMVGSALRADRNRYLTQFSVLRGLRTAMERRPYRPVWLVGLLSFSLFANTPPEITNVRASQRENTKLVDIYYDAADADGDLLKVRIEISDNDGLKYAVPAFSLTGDIGEGIAAGTNKHIVWDAGTDWDGEYSDKMRVKVYAIDAQGFPGLEWGNEVPPGGFLMGQDGGAEGSGESRHVCIPWSYWLSKYEITCQEYCRFLNSAFSSGYVELSGVKKAVVSDKMPMNFACPSASELCELGDDKNIRWNVNQFEPTTTSASNLPASVTWYGAIAFARFYGYDLPTEAEWEKATRGSENDDQGEHLLFPWGNEISSSYANIKPSTLKRIGYYDGNQTPVGPDTVNGYGLYDVIGNAGEWTLSREGITSNSSSMEVVHNGILEYPQQENLLSKVHNPFVGSTRVVRGYADNPSYYRQGVPANSSTFRYLTGYSYSGSSYAGYYSPQFYTTSDALGFRVIRRNGVSSAAVKVAYHESFDDWQLTDVQNSSVTNDTTSGRWIIGGTTYTNVSVSESGVDDTKCLYFNNSSSRAAYIPICTNQLVSLSFKARAPTSNSLTVSLEVEDETCKNTTISSSYSDSSDGVVHELKINFPEVVIRSCYISVSQCVYIDDIKVTCVSNE